MISTKEINDLAFEINTTVTKLLESSSCIEDDDLDLVDIKYAEAVLTWRLNKDIKLYFETDNKVFLFFKKELEKKFELEILSKEQAKIRQKQLQRMLLSLTTLVS